MEIKPLPALLGLALRLDQPPRKVSRPSPIPPPNRGRLRLTRARDCGGDVKGKWGAGNFFSHLGLNVSSDYPRKANGMIPQIQLLRFSFRLMSASAKRIASSAASAISTSFHAPLAAPFAFRVSGVRSGRAPGPTVLRPFAFRVFASAMLLASLAVWPRAASPQVHNIFYHANPGMNYSDAMFNEHLDFLKDNGYHTVTMDEFMDWLLNNTPLPLRPIVISADDNYIQVYTSMYPRLREHGMTAVNFAHTNYVGVNTGNDHCDWNEIREMETAGVVFTESHTKTHRQLSTLADSVIQDEAEGSKKAIEDNIPGKTCRYIAYPYGDYNQKVLDYCEAAGYAGGFRVGGGANTHQTPLFELSRTGVDGFTVEQVKQSIGFYQLAPAPPSPGYVLDNADAAFFCDPAVWTLSTSGGALWGSDQRVRAPNALAGKAARWAARLPENGWFRIHAWWTSADNSSTLAVFTIWHDGGEAQARTDQSTVGGQWITLGTFKFTDRPVEVRLDAADGGALSADALWFEPVAAPAAPQGWILF